MSEPQAPHGRKIEYIGQRVYPQPEGGYRCFMEVKWALGPDGVRHPPTIVETPVRSTWGDAMADALRLSTLLEAAP
jgi:hypothetical protein